MTSGPTYTPIATYTTTGSVANYTFTSIPSTYTDIILVGQGAISANARIDLLMGNGSISTSGYSNTEVYGNGSAAYSLRVTSSASMQGLYDSIGTGSGQINFMAHFMNYTSTTYKTVLGRYSSATNAAGAMVGLWQSGAAINQIQISPTSNFSAGFVLTLYGIASA